MHTQQRVGSIDRIYLHTNEGPQEQGGAAGLAHYLDHIDAGYHVIVDDTTTIRKAGDDQVVWAEGGDNEHALSICMIGRAAQNWGVSYSLLEIERAAQVAAAWCKAYGIPPTHVRSGAPGQAPTDRGIAEHADDHDPNSQGHTDPGAGFPIAAFCARVAAIMSPPIDWEAVKRLIAWRDSVSANPLHANQFDGRVPLLKLLLAEKGWNVGNLTVVYGSALTTAVEQFKHARHLASIDGTVFGHDAAFALLA